MYLISSYVVRLSCMARGGWRDPAPPPPPPSPPPLFPTLLPAKSDRHPCVFGYVA